MAAGGGAVSGILINASVLLPSSESEPLPEASRSLLRTLNYSKIPTGVFYKPGLPANQVRLLEEMVGSNLWSSSIENIVEEVSVDWRIAKLSSVLVVSNYTDYLSLALKNPVWVTVILCTPRQVLPNDLTSTGNSSIIFINKLEELPLKICSLNKKVESNILVVGYTMKSSREEDFAKRGAFPLCPTGNGLIFFPLNLELCISSQLQEVDILLHKATDEIKDVVKSKIIFTNHLQELQSYTEQSDHVDLCVIDPFDNIYPVVDRLKIQEILCGLEDLGTKGSYKIRGPNFLKIDSFEEPDIEGRLSKARLSPPYIVKPQVACGVKRAHSMAIVFKLEDFQGQKVPLPAVIQEYVDHSSRLYKFYVLGEKVFHAVKKSTPNAATLMRTTKGEPMAFDSLTSLPVGEKSEQLDAHQQLDLELVTDAANWLKNVLNLTIFGFDVVVQDGTGDHVIVDVNYLPSFKEVPDGIAVPAFWEAIKWKYTLQKKSRIGATVP